MLAVPAGSEGPFSLTTLSLKDQVSFFRTLRLMDRQTSEPVLRGMTPPHTHTVLMQTSDLSLPTDYNALRPRSPLQIDRRSRMGFGRDLRNSHEGLLKLQDWELKVCG